MQSVEQIVVTPDGSKLITLGSRGLGTGTFGVFRYLVHESVLCCAVLLCFCKHGRYSVRVEVEATSVWGSAQSSTGPPAVLYRPNSVWGAFIGAEFWDCGGFRGCRDAAGTYTNQDW